MTHAKRRPLELTINGSGFRETCDDDKTPEYPLSDDHPLSLHNRASLLKARTNSETVPKCEVDIVLPLPLSSEVGILKSPNLKESNLEASTENNVNHNKVKGIHPKEASSVLQENQGHSSSHILNALREKIHKKTSDDTKRRKDSSPSVIDALDLATDPSKSVTNSLFQSCDEKSDTLLVRSLIDREDIGATQAKVTKDVNSVWKLPCVVRPPLPSIMRQNFQLAPSTDSNNNSGDNIIRKFETTVSNLPPSEGNPIHCISAASCRSNASTKSPQSSKMDTSNLSDVKERKPEDLGVSMAEPCASSNFSSEAEVKSPMPPNLSPVTVSSQRCDDNVSSVSPTCPPFLTPVKLDSISYPNARNESLIVRKLDNERILCSNSSSINSLTTPLILSGNTNSLPLTNGITSLKPMTSVTTKLSSLDSGTSNLPRVSSRAKRLSPVSRSIINGNQNTVTSGTIKLSPVTTGATNLSPVSLDTTSLSSSTTATTDLSYETKRTIDATDLSPVATSPTNPSNAAVGIDNMVTLITEATNQPSAISGTNNISHWGTDTTTITGTLNLSPVTAWTTNQRIPSSGTTNLSPVTTGSTKLSHVTFETNILSPVTSGNIDLSPVTTETTNLSPVITGTSNLSHVITEISNLSPVNTRTTNLSYVTTGTTYLSSVTTGTTNLSPVTTGTTNLSHVTIGTTNLSPVTTGTTNLSHVTIGTTNLLSVTTGTTNLSPVTTGTTNLSPVTTGTTNLSPVTTGTTNLSPVTTGTTNLSPVISSTTYMTLMTLAITNLTSVTSTIANLTPVGTTRFLSHRTTETSNLSPVPTGTPMFGETTYLASVTSTTTNLSPMTAGTANLSLVSPETINCSPVATACTTETTNCTTLTPIYNISSSLGSVNVSPSPSSSPKCNSSSLTSMKDSPSTYTMGFAKPEKTNLTLLTSANSNPSTLTLVYSNSSPLTFPSPSTPRMPNPSSLTSHNPNHSSSCAFNASQLEQVIGYRPKCPAQNSKWMSINAGSLSLTTNNAHPPALIPVSSTASNLKLSPSNLSPMTLPSTPTSSNTSSLTTASSNPDPLTVISSHSPFTSSNNSLPKTSASCNPSPLTSSYSNPSPLTTASSNPSSLTPASSNPSPLTTRSINPLPLTPASSNPLPLTPASSNPSPLISASSNPLPLTTASSLSTLNPRTPNLPPLTYVHDPRLRFPGFSPYGKSNPSHVAPVNDIRQSLSGQVPPKRTNNASPRTSTKMHTSSQNSFDIEFPLGTKMSFNMSKSLLQKQFYKDIFIHNNINNSNAVKHKVQSVSPHHYIANEDRSRSINSYVSLSSSEIPPSIAQSRKEKDFSQLSVPNQKNQVAIESREKTSRIHPVQDQELSLNQKRQRESDVLPLLPPMRLKRMDNTFVSQYYKYHQHRDSSNGNSNYNDYNQGKEGSLAKVPRYDERHLNQRNISLETDARCTPRLEIVTTGSTIRPVQMQMASAAKQSSGSLCYPCSNPVRDRQMSSFIEKLAVPKEGHGNLVSGRPAQLPTGKGNHSNQRGTIPLPIPSQPGIRPPSPALLPTPRQAFASFQRAISPSLSSSSSVSLSASASSSASLSASSASPINQIQPLSSYHPNLLPLVKMQPPPPLIHTSSPSVPMNSVSQIPSPGHTGIIHVTKSVTNNGMLNSPDHSLPIVSIRPDCSTNSIYTTNLPNKSFHKNLSSLSSSSSPQRRASFENQIMPEKDKYTQGHQPILSARSNAETLDLATTLPTHYSHNHTPRKHVPILTQTQSPPSTFEPKPDFIEKNINSKTLSACPPPVVQNSNPPRGMHLNDISMDQVSNTHNNSNTPCTDIHSSSSHTGNNASVHDRSLPSFNANNGQSEPLDLSSKHLTSSQDSAHLSEKALNLTSVVWSKQDFSSSPLTDKREAIASDIAELYNRANSSKIRAIPNHSANERNPNSDIPSDVTADFFEEKIKDNSANVSTSTFDMRRLRESSQSEEASELSLPHEPNLVMDLENDEWGSNPSQNRSVYQRKTQALPVKNFFSSTLDEKSYSRLAFAAITSKKKKSLARCNIPTENEDFLDFLRQRGARASSNSQVDDLTFGFRNGEFIDLTQDRDEVLSISSDEVLEDMNIVFDPKIDIDVFHSSNQRLGETFVSSAHAVDKGTIHSRPDSVDTLLELNHQGNEMKNDSSHEIMSFPTNKAEIESIHSDLSATHLNSETSEIYNQEPEPILNITDWSHIKEQSLAFSRPQKAWMSRRIQEIISKNSNLLPENVPSINSFGAFSRARCSATNHVSESIQGENLIPYKFDSSLVIASNRSDTYHLSHRTYRRPSSEALKCPTPKCPRVKRSMSVETDSPSYVQPNTSTNLLRPSSMLQISNNYEREYELDLSKNSEPTADVVQQARKYVEVHNKESSPYKTVWQTQFYTFNSPAKGDDKIQTFSSDKKSPRDIGDDVYQRLQMMHQAENSVSQSQANLDKEKNFSIEEKVIRKRKTRRSALNRGHQPKINLTSDETPPAFPLDTPQQPDAPHNIANLPPTSVSGQFLPSPFVVTPYYAMAYPVCYPAFQGVPTANQPILLSPHATALDAVEKKTRRSGGRKRGRRTKSQFSNGTAKKMRRRYTTGNDDAELEIVAETNPNSHLEIPGNVQGIERFNNDGAKTIVYKTRNERTEIGTNQEKGELLDPLPTTHNRNRDHVQELFNCQPVYNPCLMETRKEDGLTVLSLQYVNTTKANDTIHNISATTAEPRYSDHSSPNDQDNLLRPGIDPFPAMSRDSILDDQPSSVLTPQLPVNFSINQNLATLALASEAHGKMVVMESPLRSEDEVNNNVTPTLTNNNGLDHVSHSRPPSSELLQSSSIPISIPASLECPNGESSSLLCDWTEEEKLATQTLMNMMQNNRNSNS